MPDSTSDIPGDNADDTSEADTPEAHKPAPEAHKPTPEAPSPEVDAPGPQTEHVGWSVSRGTGVDGVTFKGGRHKQTTDGPLTRGSERLRDLALSLVRSLAVPDAVRDALTGAVSDTEVIMSRRELLESIVVLGVSGSVAAAVGATSSVFSSSAGGRQPGSPAAAGGEPNGRPFPIGASTRARTKPVQIDFWHSMSSVNQTTLSALTNQFNSAQGDVHVNLVQRASYLDTVNTYLADLRRGRAGALPDLVQVQTTDLRLIADTGSVAAVENAIDAEHYAVDDYLPATLEAFRLEGVLWALPFNMSCQVLYYDRNAFVAAGLDPNAPPSSLAELMAAAQKIVSGKIASYGMSLKVSDAVFESLLALEGSYLADNRNGRAGRATAVTFDDEAGKTIFDWWAEMLSSRLAQATPSSTYDNLVGIGRRTAPMTFETSAGLSTVVSVLDQFPGVSAWVAPLTAPASPRGGCIPMGAGLCIVSRSGPERQDAAWSYLKFLNEPAQQAAWAAATGFVPVRKSAVGLPQLAQVWSTYPAYAVAYQQLANSPAGPLTAGAAVGPFTQIESAIDDALISLSSGVTPQKAITNASRAASQAIASYNARL